MFDMSIVSVGNRIKTKQTGGKKKKTVVKNIGWVWVLTILLGLAGGFPLYLYLKEKASTNKA